MLVVLLLATIAYGASVSPYFLDSTNLFFIGLNVGEIAIIALPLTLIIITGEIDLSVASMLGLTGLFMAELFKHGWPIWPAMIAAVLLGGVLGAFNGFLITRIGLPSLAVTIGTLTLYRGIAQGILPSDTISGFPQGLANIGVVPIPHTHISYSVVIFLPLAVVFGIVLHATPLGRAIFAIGANQEAAFYSGIRVKRIKFWLFVLSGMAVASRACSGRSASRRLATTPASGSSSSSSRPSCSAASRSSVAAARSSASSWPSPFSAALQTAMTADVIPAQDQNIVIGGLLLASVIVPNIGDIYRRARARLRIVGARRQAAVVTREEGT